MGPSRLAIAAVQPDCIGAWFMATARGLRPDGSQGESACRLEKTELACVQCRSWFFHVL